MVILFCHWIPGQKIWYPNFVGADGGLPPEGHVSL